MHLKKFEAPNTTEALALVKEEFGENAVILSSKTLDAGTSRQRIQVMAALDSDLEAAASSGPAVSRRESQRSSRGSGGGETNNPFSSRQNCDPSPLPSRVKARAPETEIPQQRTAQIGGAGRPQLKKAAADGQQREYSISPGTGSLERRKAPAGPASAARTNKPGPEEIARWRDELISRVRTSTLQVDSSGYPVILSLIGPTGAGKTTTAAKLAAWYSLKEGYKVAMLSMDCYRIGATDQLRTYARIMRLPCEVAMHKEDLSRLVTRYQHYDIIIVDTAGKSPYDDSHIEELEDWFSTVPELRPYLVLSATTKKEDLKYTLETYSCLNNAGLVLSKLDETRSYAKLCQQVASSDIPVSYLTTGQKVPEDFIPASRPIVEGLFKKGWPSVRSARDRLAGVMN